MRRFSCTERPGKIPRPSGMWTSPARRISWGLALVMSLPSNVTFPLNGGTSPDTVRAKVLFPAPLAPSTATTEPAGTSSDTSNKACTEP